MTPDLNLRLAHLVHRATAGAIPVTEALSGASLRALGLDSLSALRLIDAIDLEYGVEIDISDALGLDTLDGITRMVAEKL